ncbi:hypothetical protein J3R82DRAFT_11052 [Butyriboletus roseoflavus]|nr:hypothetical protein J3R82DRAFT_11052 [Butyriboletus roseoflavus]
MECRLEGPPCPPHLPTHPSGTSCTWTGIMEGLLTTARNKHNDPTYWSVTV